MSNGQSPPLFRLPSVPEVSSFHYSPVENPDGDNINTVSPPQEPADGVRRSRSTRSRISIGPEIGSFDYVPLDDDNTVSPPQETNEISRARSTGSISTVSTLSPPGSARGFRSSRPPSYGSEASLLRGMGVENFNLSPALPQRPMALPPANGIVRQVADLSEHTHMEDMRKKWGSEPNFTVPMVMVLLFLCGLGGAIGHHVYYTLRHEQPAIDQVKHVRIGTFLAFLTKACLVGASVIGFRQRAWYTVRRKAIKLCGLDSLFGVIEDPLSFVWPKEAAKEMLTKAKLASFMGLIIWLIPAASIIAPATLTTELVNVDYPATNCSVRTLNFTRELDADWQKPRNKRVGYCAAFFHRLEKSRLTNQSLEWYSGPSLQYKRIAESALFEDSPVKFEPSPCPEFNCTNKISFEAPWYKCEVMRQPKLWDKAFNISRFAGQRREPHDDYLDELALPDNIIFKEYHQSDNYTDNNERSTWVSETDQSSLFPEKGAMTIWDDWQAFYLGWAWNSSIPAPNREWPFHLEDGKNYTAQKLLPPEKKWPFQLIPKVARCSYHLAQYEVTSRWTAEGSVARDVVVDRNTARPLVEGPDRIIKDRLVYPNATNYRLVASYHALSKVVGDIVQGLVKQPHYGHATITESRVTMTSLFTFDHDLGIDWPSSNMEQAFERAFQKMVIALLSNPFVEISQEMTTECKLSRSENRFHYYPETLLLPYGAAIIFSFLWVIVGFICIRQNGMVASSNFSSFLATTRDTTLDMMVRSFPGASLGATPMPPDLKNTRLRFGIMRGEVDGAKFECGMPHAAFGMPEHQLPEPLGKDVLQMDSLVEEWRRQAGVVPPAAPGYRAQPPIMTEKAFFG